MPTLTLEEMETHFSIVASDRSIVEIYSDDPVMQRKIEAVGAVLVKEQFDYGHGKHYLLPANQLSLRKPTIPRSLTPEQKAAQVETLAKARQARRTLSNDNATS